MLRKNKPLSPQEEKIQHEAEKILKVLAEERKKNRDFHPAIGAVIVLFGAPLAFILLGLLWNSISSILK